MLASDNANPPADTEPASPARRYCSADSAGFCQTCGARTLAFCATLDDAELVGLAEVRTDVQFVAGQQLFADGDPARDVFNLVSGCVRLFKLLADGRRQITGFVLPGEYFGMAGAERYPHAAEAVAPTRACRLPRRHLDELAARYPAMQKRMLEMAWDEVARMQDQLLLLGRKRPDERVASFLLTLAARHARIGLAESPLDLPMNRGDIADYLGLTVETVSRSFTRLRSSGLIALPRSTSVVLRDARGLAALAEAE